MIYQRIPFHFTFQAVYQQSFFRSTVAYIVILLGIKILFQIEIDGLHFVYNKIMSQCRCFPRGIRLELHRLRGSLRWVTTLSAEAYNMEAYRCHYVQNIGAS